MDKILKLKILSEEIASCQKCQLHSTRKQTVFSRGSVNAEIVFLGEAPGEQEDDQGVPFCGRSGKLLDVMITSMGLSQEEIYIMNVVKCRPPNNRKPLPVETDACFPFFVKQLDLINPKVIVALGATATERILGIGPGITKRRGQWGKWNNILVMPTYHPAYLLRNPAAKIETASDLREVLVFLGKISKIPNVIDPVKEPIC